MATILLSAAGAAIGSGVSGTVLGLTGTVIGRAVGATLGGMIDQKLFGQHGVHWIKDGLNDAGKIMIFNNGNGRPGQDYSSIEILVPTQDANGGYMMPDSDPFGPEEPDWIYGDEGGEAFYSPYLSNAQRLVNNNTLINSGSPGRIFEIDADRNTVWQYEIPLFGDTPATQGGNINNNANFRAYKYPYDYPGFEGVDLTPGATIENGVNPIGCEVFVDVEDLEQNKPSLDLQYSPDENSLKIINPQHVKAELSVFGVNGRCYQKEKIKASAQTIQLPHDLKGIYFVQILTAQGEGFSEKLVLLGS
jgi:hypothetical protein